MLPLDDAGFPEALLPYMRGLSEAIAALMEDLRAGVISLDEWEEMFAELLTSYQAMAYLDASQKDSIAGDSLLWLTAWLATQLDFLSGFKAAIAANTAAGGGWSAAYPSRAQLYTGSLVAPWWWGETEGLPLPALPGDGSSDCGQLDACGWVIQWIDRERGDADAFWVLNKQRVVKEHCQTCIERAAQWAPLQIRGWELRLPGMLSKERAISKGLTSHKHSPGGVVHDQATHGHRALTAIGGGGSSSMPTGGTAEQREKVSTEMVRIGVHRPVEIVSRGEIGLTGQEGDAHYDPKTDTIKITSRAADLPAKELAGVIAHENAHGDYAALEKTSRGAQPAWERHMIDLNRDYMRRAGEDYDFDERQARLDNYRILISEIGGVSRYSNQFWSKPEVTTSRPYFKRAVTETLAEVARLRAEGSPVAPLWNTLYDLTFASSKQRTSQKHLAGSGHPHDQKRHGARYSVTAAAARAEAIRRVDEDYARRGIGPEGAWDAAPKRVAYGRETRRILSDRKPAGARSAAPAPAPEKPRPLFEGDPDRLASAWDNAFFSHYPAAKGILKTTTGGESMAALLKNAENAGQVPFFKIKNDFFNARGEKMTEAQAVSQIERLLADGKKARILDGTPTREHEAAWAKEQARRAEAAERRRASRKKGLAEFKHSPGGHGHDQQSHGLHSIGQALSGILRRGGAEKPGAAAPKPEAEFEYPLRAGVTEGNWRTYRIAGKSGAEWARISDKISADGHQRLRKELSKYEDVDPKAAHEYMTRLDQHRRLVLEETLKVAQRYQLSGEEQRRLIENVTRHDALDKYNARTALGYIDQWAGRKGAEKAYWYGIDKHHERNPHHAEHWVNPETGKPRQMPTANFVEMVGDWRATAKWMGTPLDAYYRARGDRRPLHKITRAAAERELGITETPFPELFKALGVHSTS